MAERTVRARRWSAFASLSGDFLLLACALTGFLLSFFSLYVDRDNIPAASRNCNVLELVFRAHDTRQQVVFALCLALVATLLWSLPRFRRVTAGVVFVGWVGAVVYFREDVWNGARLTAKAIADLFSSRVEGVGTFPLELELMATQMIQAGERFLLLAALLLALLLGWAIRRSPCWWLVAALTLGPLLPGLLANLYPDWWAFVLLMSCWCAMLLTDLSQRALPSGGGSLTLVVLPAVGALLAAISLLFPLEGYTRPQWTFAAEEQVVSFGNRYFTSLSELDGPFGSKFTYVGSAETVDLTDAGPLNYSGRTVLKVTSEGYTGEVYLRGASLARYIDNSWQPMEEAAYRQYADALGENAPSPLLFPNRAAPGREYILTVQNTGASAACAYLPYYLTDQNWEEAGVVPIQDAFFARRTGQLTHTVAFAPGLSPEDGMDQSEAQQQYSDFVYDNYLEVPEELEDILLSLTAGLDRNGPLAAGEAVGALLNELCSYDPNTPAVPEGEDFVEYFLTESHRGYCMHFASAATLMLRAMDVPARYVSGFTAQLTAGETVEVPDWSAHAWVEVYVEGFGWQLVEVTPGYGSQEEPTPAPTTGPEPSPAPGPTQALPEPSNSPEPTTSPEPAPGHDQAVEGPGVPGGEGTGSSLQGLLDALKWLAATGAACALLWLGQFLPKRWRERRLSAPDVNRAALEGYRYLKRLEKWGGTVPEAALELARKARFSQHTLTKEEQRTMVELFHAQRLALSRTLPPVKRLAFRYLWGWPKREAPKARGPRKPHD